MKRTNLVANSTPLNRFTGIKDNPTKTVYPGAPGFSIHMPLVFINSPKGTTDKVTLDAAGRLDMYGTKAYDELGTYYNENTYLSQVLSSVSNDHCTVRVKPDDAGEPANITIYADIIKTKVPKWKRNKDGAIVKDSSGKKVQDGTNMIDGYRVRYFSMPFQAGKKVGEMQVLEGSMQVGSVKSKMYPIMDVPAKYFGSEYNNIGFNITPIVGTNFKNKFKTVAKALPYEISVFHRENKDSNGKRVKTLIGGKSSIVTFKQQTKHPYTEAPLDIDLLFPHAWGNDDAAEGAIKYYEMDSTHVYYNNIETILTEFMKTEAPHITNTTQTFADGDAKTLDWFDFTKPYDVAKNEELHLFNWVTLKSVVNNVDYISIQKEENVYNPNDIAGNTLTYGSTIYKNVAVTAGAKQITMGTKHITYLEGGSDGTLNAVTTEKFIREYMKQYLDADSKVNSLLLNPETSFYDTGYLLDTKKSLLNALAVRPDTVVHLATFMSSYGITPMTLQEEYAVAVALMARAELYTESDYWGTSVCRATIILGSMRKARTYNKKRYTQNFELAKILGRYLGSATGRMNGTYALDESRTNTELTLGQDYQPDHIPDSFKETLWDNGVTYSEPFKLNRRAFLAVKTVHGNQQSILTSPITMYANSVVCRILDSMHKKYAGNEKDSRELFAAKFIKDCEKLTNDIFDNKRYTVDYRVEFTKEDIQRGYSYVVYADIYGNVAKTAQVSIVSTYAN